jgi:hypothetical protein
MNAIPVCTSILQCWALDHPYGAAAVYAGMGLFIILVTLAARFFNR